MKFTYVYNDNKTNLPDKPEKKTFLKKLLWNIKSTHFPVPYRLFSHIRLSIRFVFSLSRFSDDMPTNYIGVANENKCRNRRNVTLVYFSPKSASLIIEADAFPRAKSVATQIGVRIYSGRKIQFSTYSTSAAGGGRGSSFVSSFVRLSPLTIWWKYQGCYRFPFRILVASDVSKRGEIDEK